MTLEGPVISVQPAPVMSLNPTQHLLGPMPINKRLMNIQKRDRCSSTGDSIAPAVKQTVTSFTPPIKARNASHSPNFLSVSLSPQGCDIQRSQSLPRGVRANSQEPEVTQSLHLRRGIRATLSPRFMRRSETIDTDTIVKAEYEEYTQVNQYKVLDIIGHGSYGIVRKATTVDDEVYAMKILGKKRLKRKSFSVGRPRPMRGGAAVSLPNDPLDDIKREIAILKKLDHQNVVKLTEVLDDPREDELILVFEYLPHGAIIDRLPAENTFSEDASREYFKDILLGLEYLHSQHIIHRDIKPQNLLLDDNNRIKIADFGVSEVLDTSVTHLKRSAGTPAFLAPECLDASKKTYRGQEVDIWAAGVTLYCFIFGNVPWSSKYITELHEKIKTEDAPLHDEIDISPELKDLLGKLLEKDPDQRISIPEIRQHPWILQGGQALPSQEENCQAEIEISEEEIQDAFKTYRTPIHILVMIKQMARRRSLAHPFSPRNSPRHSPATSPATSPKVSPRSSPQHYTEPTPISPPISPSTLSQDRRERWAKSHNAPSIAVDQYEDSI